MHTPGPVMTEERRGLEGNVKANRCKLPISDYVDGEIVVRDRTQAEVRERVVELHRTGKQPLSICVALSVPLFRVKIILRSLGVDVSEYKLDGVEAYSIPGA